MPQEGPKPEQYQLEIDKETVDGEVEEKVDESTENNNGGTTDDQENRVKIVANDDETCGEGHKKDTSGWN